MARSFNGTSDLITIAIPATDTSTLINVGCWFKTSTATGALLCSDSGSTSGRVLQLKVSTTHVSFTLGSSGTLHTITGTVVVNDGKWHHVVGTFDGTTMKLYIDKVLDGTLTTGATNTLASKNMRIGAQISGVTQQFFTGQIQEAFLRFSGITLGEIQSLASGLSPFHIAPAHYWPLFGRDSPEPDLGVGSHASGALTGTTYANGGLVSPKLLTV